MRRVHPRPQRRDVNAVRCADGPRRAGSTLAEALVALLLIGVAVLSLGGAASAAAAALRGAALEQGAVLAAEALLDSLAAEADVQPGELMRGPWTLQWMITDSAGSRLIELEVRYADGNAERRLRFGLRSARPPALAPEPI